MTFSSDLCTLSTLTESTLLCSIEQRCRGDLTQSYVGGILLSLGPSSKTTGSQFLPSFASSVLRSLAFTGQDQSILISGYHGTDKTTLFTDLLTSLLPHLGQHLPDLGSSLLLVSELLDYLSSSDEEDSCSGAVLVTTLFVNPTNLMLSAACVSCLLLDTSAISQYKVFSDKDGFNRVKSCLLKLGMEPGLVQQVSQLLSAVQDLLTGTAVSQVFGNIGISRLPSTLPSEATLVQLLYAYLVQWVVCWANATCLQPQQSHGCCSVSLVCAPGHGFSPERSATLPALVIRYTNEVLHNICCTRLFVWEQEQYLEEGIEWEEVEVEFNQSLINCYHQEDGSLWQVLGLQNRDAMRAGIERCCRVSSDACFVLGQEKDGFTLAHFTGEYEYRVNGKWMETDRVHVVSAGLQASLMTSSCRVLVEMAQNMSHSADVMPYTQKMACSKLTQRARKAMDSVCEVLTTSQPHFVFCFKPGKNGKRAFNCELVLSQLQQFKVLDIALIQSCGFPVRLPHSNFLKNYGDLCIENNTQVLSDKEKCVLILKSSQLRDWHVGLTMVMLKPWHLTQLDSALDLFDQSAKKLQRAFKRSIYRKRQSLPTCELHNNPPSPPPRPVHTLSSQDVSTTPPSPWPSDYDCASSPTPPAPRNKHSWRKAATSASTNPSPTSNSPTNLQSFKWFQGKLSREKAEKQLQAIDHDCFLIRESENRVGEYALSLRHEGIIKHFRIDTKHGVSTRYELYGAKRSFPSLEVLVDYYGDHCVSSSGELLTVPYSIEEGAPPAGVRRKLSSMRRSAPSAPSLTGVPMKGQRLPGGDSPETHSKGLSEDLLSKLQKELEVEERIVEAARRMTELPTSSRKERQKRKQSLQQVQSRLLRLKQQFHTLQERKRFIEMSMLNEQ